MRQNKIIIAIIYVIILSFCNITNAQTLPEILSSDKPVVERNVKDGISRIFFDSRIEDLSIICTDENPDEPIVKVGENMWCMYIDTKKDVYYDDACFRNFLIHGPSSTECYLTTPIIEPSQVLYYTIKPKLKVKLSTDNKVDRSASNGMASIFFDCRMRGIEIICVDGAPKEIITKMDERLQLIHINVNKDFKTKELFSRTFVLKSENYPIVLFKTGLISPNQVLYYTVMESEELEAQLVEISVIE